MKAPNEQYFRFPRHLLTSPAWSVLNIHERRAFDRIMVEHQTKSGFVNDGLPVTKRDFVKFGVQPKHVAGSLRVLRELGIIECTRNMGGSLSGRTPNMWRPTFLPRTPTSNDATHDYLKITTSEQAKHIAEAYRERETRKNRPPPPRTRKPRKRSAPSTATA
jgi:hypothetical protein